jgi:hypothetical protein
VPKNTDPVTIDEFEPASVPINDEFDVARIVCPEPYPIHSTLDVFDCPFPALTPIIVVLTAFFDIISVDGLPEDVPTYTLFSESPMFSWVTVKELAVTLSIFRILNDVANPLDE